MFESKLHPGMMEIKFFIVLRNFPDLGCFQNFSLVCVILPRSYFTTDFTESTGNARINSNNNIRGFIRDPDSYRDCGIRGELIHGHQNI